MPLESSLSFHSESLRRPIAIWFFRLYLLTVLCFVPGATRSLPETPPSNNGSTELKVGASGLREIAGGSTQSFEITLAAGQLLQFSVDKGDLGFSLVIYGPAGQKLVEQVSQGYELMEVSISANVAGTHRLEVSSRERVDVRRSYQINVEPIRNADVSDSKDSTARRAMAEAGLLRGDWTEVSLGKAIKKYEEASQLWLSARNFRRAASASMATAEVYLLLGEYREALHHYTRAASEAGSAKAKLEESAAFSKMGRLYSYLGNNDLAQTDVRRALDYHAAAGGTDQALSAKHAYAEVLADAGEVDYSKGDLVKCLQRFTQSLKLFGEIGDRRGEARAHRFLGYMSGGMGDRDKVVTEISTALALYQEIGDKTGEGLSLTALGLTQSLKRQNESAIKMHRDAIAIFRAIGDRQSEGIALNGIGQAYEYLREFRLALDHNQQAFRLFQAKGSLDLAAASMFKVAKVNRLMGNQTLALAKYQECLELSRAAKKTLTEANALNDVASIYAAQGNRTKTLGQLRKILSFYHSIGELRGQAVALNNLGDFFLREGEGKKALSLYVEALPLSEQAGELDALITTLYNIARANRDWGSLDEALDTIRKSIKVIEEFRTNVASPEFRSSYFAGVRKHYDLCIDILMRLDGLRPGHGFAADALLVSESARARSLVDILTEARADIRQGVNPKLLDRERQLRGLLQAQAQYQMDLSISGKNPAEAAEVAHQMEQLRAEYQEVEAQVRDRTPRFNALVKPLSLDAIKGELDSNTILLEYALGDESSYLWTVTPNSLRSFKLPSRAILEDAGREYYKLVTARQAVAKISDKYQGDVDDADRLLYDKALNLSRMLLGDAFDQLGNKRLVIVTEGVLQYIPLDALPMPRKSPSGQEQSVAAASPENLPPLIEIHEIVNIPSISTLVAIRQEKRRAPSRNKVVAVLADPVFSQTDDRVKNRNSVPAVALSKSDEGTSQPALRGLDALKRNGGTLRLVHASEEADAILAAAPRGAGMVAKDFDASRETAISPLIGQYQIVHFATHGYMDSERPEFSGIVLTMVNEDGSKAEGFMTLQDIYRLSLSADLTVLSACDTALGKDIKGEGMVGLTRGFMYAGSRSVVASLWKVDDRASAALMGHFYKAMLQDGMTPAAALRSAKQTLRKQEAWSAPFFWAGFVLQGEYNERIIIDRKSWLPIGLAVSLMLVLTLSGLLILKRRRRHSGVDAP